LIDVHDRPSIVEIRPRRFASRPETTTSTTRNGIDVDEIDSIEALASATADDESIS